MCSVSLLSPRGRLFLIGMLIVFILTGPPGLSGDTSHTVCGIGQDTGYKVVYGVMGDVAICDYFWSFSVQGES